MSSTNGRAKLRQRARSISGAAAFTSGKTTAICSAVTAKVENDFAPSFSSRVGSVKEAREVRTTRGPLPANNKAAFIILIVA